LVDLLVVFVQDLRKLAQNMMVFAAHTSVINCAIIVLVQSKQLLFENVKFVLNILNIATKRSFYIHIGSSANFFQPLLDGFTNFLRKFQGCHAMFYLHISCVEIDAKDHFSVLREHGL